MDLTNPLPLLDEAVAALKAPLTEEDRSQGWTDDLRREIQEEISLSRSALRRHGLSTARYLRPRWEEWLDREGVRPGRLRTLVAEVQGCLKTAAGSVWPPWHHN
ncbi:hypothetical protein AQJ30_22630 [Streptomyces longwoodensis]|uniref:Uncharacterized protein n=1 Tax=Streptomyces longwoodensis TaxID=68231 RepID=A0A101QUT4_9ACTN|nr:hypothetical protein [Streptomyces longwoodensis]KUN36408.1 hypothetical protein AQJ30_22630 [Streptomyces longwoodensis]